jgi:hypothetical protein
MRSRRLVAPAVVATLVLLLTGCTRGGDGYAAGLAERIIIGIGDDITPAYPKPRDAEFLADWAITDPRLPATEGEADYDITALAWSGNSGDPEGATVDIRVAVHVHPYSPNTIGGISIKQGDAVRCWRLTVFGLHDYDSLKRSEINCPEDSGVVPKPDPAPLPSLPDDVEPLLIAALADATPEDFETRVRAAFPDEAIVIQTAVANGELVAAVGIPVELQCAVGVRHADGTVGVSQGFKEVLLQPGEVGCSPELYLHPTVTH